MCCCPLGRKRNLRILVGLTLCLTTLPWYPVQGKKWRDRQHQTRTLVPFLFVSLIQQSVPSCRQLTSKQINHLHVTLRDLFQNEIRRRVHDIGNGLELAYVVLSNLEASVVDPMACTTTLELAEIVVTFQAPQRNTPAVSTVQQWMQSAVTEHLWVELGPTKEFNFFTSVTILVGDETCKMGENTTQNKVWRNGNY